jgi:hypothetical protein
VTARPLALLAALAAASTPASAAEAASPDALLERVARHYAALERYTVELRVRVHATGAGAPSSVLAARTSRRGPLMLQELSSFVVLTRPELRVMVDRAARTIYLNPEPPLVPAVLPGLDPAAALRETRAAGYTVAARDRDGAVEVAFRPPDARPTLVFTFDREGAQLRRMQLVRAAGSEEGPALVDVEYLWSDPTSEADGRFEAASYVRPRGGGWEPAPAFAGYRVVESRAR